MELLWQAASLPPVRRLRLSIRPRLQSNSPSITISSCSGPWLHPLDIWHQMDGIHNMCSGSSHVAAMLCKCLYLYTDKNCFYHWRSWISACNPILCIYRISTEFVCKVLAIIMMTIILGFVCFSFVCSVGSCLFWPAQPRPGWWLDIRNIYLHCLYPLSPGTLREKFKHRTFIVLSHPYRVHH